jgi:alkanesulfonate monooxygenase SsuD/methylene tetrahydromethanopterin reductase-like flavin-dependent oxidoreductase (luciferase family)
VRYALSLPIGGECADPSILAEFAHIAEAAGWDAILLEDYITYSNDNYHSLPGHPTHDPWIALAAMATRTQTIRLGTCVTPLSRWRPWHLARVTATLDHLSGGRLILGVGLGDPNDEAFTHFGEAADPRRRAELLDEGLDILTGLWSGEPFSYSGVHYQVEETTFLPPPVQRPRIPIWVGGWVGTKPVLRRAARYDGICAYSIADTSGWKDFTPDDVTSLRLEIERQRTAGGVFDIVIGGRERARDWDAERTLIRDLAAAGATWWHEWVPAADERTMRRAIALGPLRVAAVPPSSSGAQPS